jgi:gliding motility-associatede transport system auxiliary component
MESRSQQWAPYLGALGVALIVGAFLLDLIFNTPRIWLLSLGGIGVILIAVFLFTRPRGELRAAVTGRTAVYGSNTLILVLAFVGIIVLINVIVSKQVSWRLDLTANQQHTLSEQTINVLKNLAEPIQVTGFFTPNSISSETDAANLIKDYQVFTSKLTYRSIDPQANPTAARQYNVVQDATLVFELGARRENVFSFTENDFTNAILKVSQVQQPAIYFTTGHGEIGPTESDVGGLSSVSTYLQQTNYKVETLNLATITATQTISGGLPADTSAVVIASPTKPFPPGDGQRLKTYLQNGGRILLMVDPQEDPGLADLLQSWGIALNNDLVLDPSLNYRGVSAIPVIAQFPSHEVTKNLQSYGVFFPGVRSMHEISGTTKSLVALFKTTDQSCGKTDFEAIKNQQQLQCDPAKDEKGPFILGYAVETPAPSASAKPSRLIVIGSSSFASNQWVQNQDSAGNVQLIENVINWLAGQEQLIAIPAKPAGSYPLNANSNLDVQFILFSNVALIPAAILLVGGLIWWRRR